MKYTDRIYGEFEITEPVILDLINCPALQRLKGVDQAGYFEPYFLGTAYSRFEHSVGVYLLLKIYNASIEEQIAGLIHDVSHSAFSHCIDYILDVGSEKEHNHQDNLFDEYVRKTEIPEILKKYNLNLDYILDDRNFPLKENNLPNLCADRIDYSLRTATVYDGLSEQDKNYILENLVAENSDWIFKNFESAKKYATIFFRMNKIYYAGLPSAIMFRTVGDCLKHSLQKKYITEEDLYTTDKIVIEKIKRFIDIDEKLKLFWERMNNKVKAKNNPENYDAEVFCKSRVVDPLFKDNEILKRVSEVEPNWGKTIEQELKPKQYFLKFER
ncbi:MAG: HD domain-containing protein [bacterium]